MCPRTLLTFIYNNNSSNIEKKLPQVGPKALTRRRNRKTTQPIAKLFMLQANAKRMANAKLFVLQVKVKS